MNEALLAEGTWSCVDMLAASCEDLAATDINLHCFWPRGALFLTTALPLLPSPLPCTCTPGSQQLLRERPSLAACPATRMHTL